MCRHLYIYICIYRPVYIYMYIYMYIVVYVLYSRMYGRSEYVCVDCCMYVWIVVCMHSLGRCAVCMCLYVFVRLWCLSGLSLSICIMYTVYSIYILIHGRVCACMYIVYLCTYVYAYVHTHTHTKTYVNEHEHGTQSKEEVEGEGDASAAEEPRHDYSWDKRYMVDGRGATHHHTHMSHHHTHM